MTQPITEKRIDELIEETNPKAKRTIDRQIAELKDILQNQIVVKDDQISDHFFKMNKYGETEGLKLAKKWDEGFREGILIALRYINNLDA